MWYGILIQTILDNTVFIQRVGRQLYTVIPIDTCTTTIHLNLFPQVRYLFQHTELLNLLNILTHIIHHLSPVIKHNI